MTCLALEFSSQRRSAAVSRDGLLLSEAFVMGGGATSAPGLMAEAMAKAGVLPADVSRLVVGIGPGSYTGIRRAIATALGWHLAMGTPIAPVESLELLARIAHDALGHDVELAADAQRDEWACASMHEGRMTTALRLRTRREIEADIENGRRVVTPDEGLPGAVVLHPTAALAAVLGPGLAPCRPEDLAPVYLREATFVKAAPRRPVPGI
ncbi:MAG: tRNA (adenosine(37)-N6)-threonylcarbamoyltransferase complex dimerization subunit type 1 TsaB [Verrucomicrobiota bacterium]|jgi:tRNA threonylcarbamoyl adenosine modification protein YeaZ